MSEPAELPQLRPPEEHAEGALELPDGVQVLEGSPVGGRRGVAVLVAKFNGEITTRMLASALEELERAGVARDAVTVVPVPGAFELPLAASYLAATGRYAGVACLGAVIRGETDHYDYVCSETARGIMDVQLRTGVPCAFGVLTVENMDQALARTGGGKRDQGAHAADAVVTLARMKRSLA
jgi:6,7-dimethyl-8-ribityllumazine synthase